MDCDEALLRRVPHRAPILRIARIVTLDGQRAIACGSAPGRPGDEMPWEACAIEGVAQTAALLGAGEVREGRLVGIRRFVCHGVPPAGIEVRYTAELVRRVGPTGLVRGRAECDGELLAEVEITLHAG